MNIFICDDERKMADLINAFIIDKYDSNTKVFYSGNELWKCLCNESCDVVFLDIDMPDMNGLDIASKMSELPCSPLLIFITSHDELVYDSLKFHPFGFVRKNYLKEELNEILDDCIRRRNEKRDFAFTTPAGNMRIPLNDILYFESEGNYLQLNTTTEKYRFRSTLYAVENAIKEFGFVRVHKGYLVNQMAVKLLGRDEVVLLNGERIPIGKSYAGTAKKILMRYML